MSFPAATFRVEVHPRTWVAAVTTSTYADGTELITRGGTSTKPTPEHAPPRCQAIVLAGWHQLMSAAGRSSAVTEPSAGKVLPLWPAGAPITRAALFDRRF